MEIEEFTFVTGQELADGTLIVFAQETELIEDGLHTMVLVKKADDDWSNEGVLGWPTISSSINEDSSAALAIDKDGEFFEMTADDGVWTGIDRIKPWRYDFRFIQNVAGRVYAGGTKRFVHRRLGYKSWEEVSRSDMHESDTSIAFEGMAGFSDTELYAVGWNGEIWSFNGAAWRMLDSPTNLILTDATTTTDKVFACGQMGTIIEGRKDSWRIVEHDVMSDDLWSAATFRNTPYFATDYGILKYENGDVSWAAEQSAQMRTTMFLSVGPSGLWSFGPHDICLFDGDTWTTIAQS